MFNRSGDYKPVVTNYNILGHYITGKMIKCAGMMMAAAVKDLTDQLIKPEAGSRP